jgi:hypothetical protein
VAPLPRAGSATSTPGKVGRACVEVLAGPASLSPPGSRRGRGGAGGVAVGLVASSGAGRRARGAGGPGRGGGTPAMFKSVCWRWC